jgi:predicted XRE-type DNA-binding protein
MKRYKNTKELALALGLSEERGQLAELKSKLTKQITRTLETQGLTHQELSILSGIPRSAITGIINGSLQKVTIDRLVRILFSLGYTVEMKLKAA